MKLNKLYEDKRGSIHLLTELGKYPEVTVFKTKAGFARGGCIHNVSNEYCVVVEGQVEYTVGDSSRFLSDGASIFIPKSTPHYFVALTDCVVMEWGAFPEEKKEKHESTRAVVEAINDSANTTVIR